MPAARPSGGVRRARSVRRRSAGLTPTRAAALLALVVGLAGLYGATSSGAFALRRTQIEGVTWTPQDAVLAALDLPEGQNLFLLDTDALARRLSVIPAIRGASVTVALPDEVRVDVAEREGLLVWQVGADRYLVDEEGLLFGRVDETSPRPRRRCRSSTTSGSWPASSPSGPRSTRSLLDAARRLGSLRPADLGTAAARFEITLDDEVGFTLEAEPVGWSAVFGFYTPSLRDDRAHPGPGPAAAEHARRSARRRLRVILADEDGDPRDATVSKPSNGRVADETPKPDRTQPDAAGPDAPATRRARRGAAVRTVSARRVSLSRTSPDGGCPPRAPAPRGSLVGIVAGLILNVNVSFELSRYSAVAIMAALDSVLGAVRAELDGVYDNRIFISGFVVNAVVAVLLVFIGDRLSLDLYLVALITLRVPDLPERGAHPAALPLERSRDDRHVERRWSWSASTSARRKVCALIGEVGATAR